MPYGHIARLEPKLGFGFLVDDAGMDWFFVREGVRDAAFDDLWLEERVGFSFEWTVKGPRAIDLHFEQVD
jgi:cold shock CspA family protein